MKMDNIYSVTIVTAQGVSQHMVGTNESVLIDGKFEDKKVDKIIVAPLYFTGDPFDHYCGFDEKGNMLFSINCLAPCEVVYFGTDK